MTSTTYGYRVPDIGDPGLGATGWFASLVYDVTRLDQHDHDGVNSALLTINNFAPFTNSILAAGWTSNSRGGYSQLVTAPAGVTDISNYNLKFIFVTPTGQVGATGYLGYTRVSATTYTVFCNDNTAAFTVLYR